MTLEVVVPYVVASVRVADFDQFLATFTTKGAEVRREHGSRGTQLYRNLEDPSEVTVVFDWDHDAFRQFMASSEGQAVMREAGLQGKPDATFLEHVTDTDS